MSIHKSSITQHTGLMPPSFLPHGITSEPMFFRASEIFASEHGGPLTDAFLAAGEELWGNLDDCILDTRWHYLMPGMYPCIPGWHVDDAPRGSKLHGDQPNLWADPKGGAEHLLCVVDAGTGSHTEFLEGDVFVPEFTLKDLHDLTGQNYFKTMDARIENGFTAPHAKRVQVSPGAVVEFNTQSWHRGMPATGKGVRWFARLTRNSNHKAANEIRHNSQVYLTETNQGW